MAVNPKEIVGEIVPSEEPDVRKRKRKGTLTHKEGVTRKPRAKGRKTKGSKALEGFVEVKEEAGTSSASPVSSDRIHSRVVVVSSDQLAALKDPRSKPNLKQYGRGAAVTASAEISLGDVVEETLRQPALRAEIQKAEGRKSAEHAFISASGESGRQEGIAERSADGKTVLITFTDPSGKRSYRSLPASEYDRGVAEGRYAPFDAGADHMPPPVLSKRKPAPSVKAFDLAATMDEIDLEKTDVIRPKGTELRGMVGVQYGGLGQPAAAQQALENRMDTAEAKLDRAAARLGDVSEKISAAKDFKERAATVDARLTEAEAKLEKLIAPAPKVVVDKPVAPVLTDVVSPPPAETPPPPVPAPTETPKAETPPSVEALPAPVPQRAEKREFPESFETADSVYTYGAGGALMRRVKESGREYPGGFVLFADFEKASATAKRDFQASLDADSDKRLYSVQLVQAGETGKRFQPITSLDAATDPDKLFFALVGRGVGVLPDSLVPARMLPETNLTPITLRFFQENGKQMGERHIAEGPVTRIQHTAGSAGALEALSREMEAKRAEWIRLDEKTKEGRSLVAKLLGSDVIPPEVEAARKAYEESARKLADAKQAFGGDRAPVAATAAADEILRTSRPKAKPPEAAELLLIKKFEKAEAYVAQALQAIERESVFEKLNRMKKRTLLVLVTVFGLGTPSFISKRPDDRLPEPQSAERITPNQELDAGGRYRGHSLRGQRTIVDQPVGKFTGNIGTEVADAPLFPLSAQVSASSAVKKPPLEPQAPAVETAQEAGAAEEETEARAAPVVLELESGDNYIQSVIELLQSRDDLKDDYDAATLKDMANHMVIDFAAKTGRSIVDLSNALPGSTITVDLEHMEIVDIHHRQAGAAKPAVPPATVAAKPTAAFDTSFTAQKPAASVAPQPAPEVPGKPIVPDSGPLVKAEQPAPAAPTPEGQAGALDTEVARVYQSMHDIITNQGHDRAAFDFLRSIINERKNISPDGLDKLMIVLGKQRDARERDLRKQGYTEEQIETDATYRELLVQQNVINRFNRFIDSVEYVMGIKMSRLDAQLKIDDIMLNVLKDAAVQGKLEKLEEYYQSAVVSNQ